MKRFFVSVVIVTAILVSACKSPTGVCAGVGMYGLNLTVNDSRTHGAITATGTVIITDGNYSHSSQIVSGHASEALDRGGTYAIVIKAAGYQDWTTTGVQVKDTGCGLVPVNVTADLIPTTVQ